MLTQAFFALSRRLKVHRKTEWTNRRSGLPRISRAAANTASSETAYAPHAFSAPGSVQQSARHSALVRWSESNVVTGCGSDDVRQFKALAMLAADVLVRLCVIKRLRPGVQSQLLSRPAGYVAGVAHHRADVPGIDLLVQ